MDVIIRKGEKKDIPSVLALIKELALFEKAPDDTESDMERDGFGIQPVFSMLVAEVNGIIAGMAIYFIKYSTWKGKGVYLDDIVVSENYRRQGIGKKLLDAVIADTHASCAVQLHWQVLDWNKPAIDFYHKYNAAMDTEWINCKLNKSQINELAMKISNS